MKKCLRTSYGLWNSVGCRLWHRRKCFLFEPQSVCSSSSKNKVNSETMFWTTIRVQGDVTVEIKNNINDFSTHFSCPARFWSWVFVRSWLSWDTRVWSYVFWNEVTFEPRYLRKPLPSNSTGSVLGLPSHESSCRRKIHHTFRLWSD